MVTVRCTQKLARKMGLPKSVTTLAPTTALGDWYATILYTRPKHLVLLVSDTSRLAVLLPASPLSTLGTRFRVALREQLQEMGISEEAIVREEEQMQTLGFGPTKSRSVLGTMNEYVYQISCDIAEEGGLYSPALLSQRLNEIICRLLQWRRPEEVGRELLDGWVNESRMEVEWQASEQKPIRDR